MASPDTVKPATALNGEPASNDVVLWRPNHQLDTKNCLALQVSRLTRHCGVAAGMAETLAPFAFAVLS